jgi:hypothetical protein
VGNRTVVTGGKQLATRRRSVKCVRHASNNFDDLGEHAIGAHLYTVRVRASFYFAFCIIT